LKLWQDTEGQEHRTDDIDGNSALLALSEAKLGGQNPGVLNNSIQAIQRLDPLGEGPDGVIIRQVDLPDSDACLGGAERARDVGGGSLAFGNGADG